MSQNNEEFQMDSNNLYEEKVYSDRKTGSIRILTPVTLEGTQDSNRATIYEGSTQLLTPMGALPLNFEIPASSLEEAIEKFPEETNKSAEKTIEQIKQMQRDASSSIITPESGGMPPAGGIIQKP